MLTTRSMRASSVGILLGFFLLAPVAPDAMLGTGDRQHVAWSYSGIIAAGPGVATAVITITVDTDNRTVVTSAENRVVAIDAESRTLVVPDE